MLTLSAAGLVSGTDFTCTSSYCEGSTLAAKGIFRTLQLTANTLASRLGLPASNQIEIDGKIGPKTVDLIQLLAISVPISAQSSLNSYGSTTKQEVARDASAITSAIGLLLQGPALPAGTPPAVAPSTGSKPPTVQIAQMVPSAGGIAPAPPSAGPQLSPVGPLLVPTTKTKYIAAGLLAAGALIVGSVAIATKRKQRRAA
jgi:hypothetical protein